MRDLKRYLTSSGDPNTRVHRDPRCPRYHSRSEDYTGPGAAISVSLLAACCAKNRIQQIELLMEAGADSNADTGSLWSPMCTAASMGHIGLLALLTAKGALIDCEHLTPLMTACRYDQLEAVKWLVEHGASVTNAAVVPDQTDRTFVRSAMLCAAEAGLVHIIEYLHAQGASYVAAAEGRADTALHAAASHGKQDCVRLILGRGVDVDIRQATARTALHDAARNGCLDVCRLLLAAGADVDASDDNDFTPLTYAMAVNHSELVELLISRGATVCHPLTVQVGAIESSTAALNILMKSSQWLDMARAERLAAECILLSSVEDVATLNAIRSLVLDMPTLIGHQSPAGRNALHYAAQVGKAIPLVCALIKEGVDPTAKDEDGLTPADVAREKGHLLQAALLERAAEDKRKRDLQQE